MIAANGVVARLLEKVSSLRRIVKNSRALGRHRATRGRARSRCKAARGA